MALDARVNFGKVVVSTGYDASATSITLVAGEGAKLPSTAPFNLVWWNNTTYADPSDDPSREVVRCTARAGDVLTITRAQEATSAADHNASGCVYKMLCGATKKVIDDLELLSIDVGTTYVWVTEYGAVGDGTTNDKAAIQAAIDAVVAAGGGVVHFPKGTFKCSTGLTVGAKVTLRGYGRDVSVLSLAAATGDLITLNANADSFHIEEMKLTTSAASTGWAITAPSSVVRDPIIECVHITNFLKGIKITGDQLHMRISNCRMTGQGGATSGGIGIQIGDGTFGGNQCLVDSCYTSSYETHYRMSTSAFVVLNPEPETGTTAFLFENSAAGVVSMPWWGSGGSAFTTDFDIQTGNGILLLGYSSLSFKINYGNASARGRTIILPERLDSSEGASYRGIKLGNAYIFGASDPCLAWVDNNYFCGWRRRTISSEITLSGATTDWSNAIPAGCVVIGVASYITQTITGSGVTAKSIGTPSATTIWANANGGLAAGSTTALGNTTQSPTTYNSATSIRVTAVGGTFSGGKIRLALTYDTLEPPTA
jgi:hypothetical protein